MNASRYGFTLQKGTTAAAMEVKDFVNESLAAGEIIALVSSTSRERLMQRGGRGY
jgi:hypothetical protein